MELLKKIHKKEGGQALVLVLVLMLVGGVTIAPLLSYMSTGLKSGQVYEGKMYKLYSADAGAEYAMNQIMHLNDPGNPLKSLHEGDWQFPPYHLHINNNLQVNVNVQKLSALEGLLGDDEYNPPPQGPGQDHSSRLVVSCNVTQATPGQGWVEYTCHVSFTWTHSSEFHLETAGAFFCPFPGAGLISSDSPYGWEGTGTGDMTGFMTLAKLEAPPQVKIAPGGFAFSWRWLNSNWPLFKSNDPNQGKGAFDFKFKINSLDWQYGLYYAWGTSKQTDFGYETSNPTAYMWVMEATTNSSEWWWGWPWGWGHPETDPTEVKVRSAAVGGTGKVTILTWEINPPHSLGYPFP